MIRGVNSQGSKTGTPLGSTRLGEETLPFVEKVYQWPKSYRNILGKTGFSKTYENSGILKRH